MSLRRLAILAGNAAIAMALIVVPRPAAAQDEECIGEKPRGGRAVSSAELYVNRARRAAGNPEDQQRLWQQGLDELERDMDDHVDDPNPQVYMLAGRFYAEMGQYLEADASWTNAVDLWSCYEAKVDTLRFNAWVRVYNRAVGYGRNGDTERARANYENAWTLYKKDPQPLLQLGASYAQEALTAEGAERADLQDKAIEYYEGAITAVENSTRPTEQQRSAYMRAASFNLAQLLAMDERFEDAAAAYGSFLAYEPGNVDAISNSAVVLTRASRKYTRDAVDMEDGPEKEAMLAKADSLRRIAVGHYSSLTTRDDLDANDYHNVGVGLTQIGLNEEAVGAFSQALDLEPFRSNSLEQLGLALFRSAQYDSLVTVAQALVERYPLNMNNLAMLANAYRETEQVDSALVALQLREAAELDFVQVRMEAEEGVYKVSGNLVNMKLESGAPIEIQFDFYDDLGEVVVSETLSVSAPEQGSFAPVSHTFESEELISGFTYKRAGS